MIKGGVMKSTSSVDKKPKYGEVFSIEQEADEATSPGFLVVVCFLFLIYATTSRPILYASIYEWFSQLFAIGSIANM